MFVSGWGLAAARLTYEVEDCPVWLEQVERREWHRHEPVEVRWLTRGAHVEVDGLLWKS